MEKSGFTLKYRFFGFKIPPSLRKFLWKKFKNWGFDCYFDPKIMEWKWGKMNNSSQQSK